MAPAFHATGLDVTSALKAGARAPAFTGELWARSGLTIGSGGALGRAARRRRALRAESAKCSRNRLGLRFARDLLRSMRGTVTSRAAESSVRPLKSIATELSRLPGVRRIAMASIAPMQGSMSQRIFLPGRDSVPTIDGIPPLDVLVSPEYFSTVGIRLVAGRTVRVDGPVLERLPSQSLAERWPVSSGLVRIPSANAFGRSREPRRARASSASSTTSTRTASSSPNRSCTCTCLSRRTCGSTPFALGPRYRARSSRARAARRRSRGHEGSRCALPASVFPGQTSCAPTT